MTSEDNFWKDRRFWSELSDFSIGAILNDGKPQGWGWVGLEGPKREAEQVKVKVKRVKIKCLDVLKMLADQCRQKNLGYFRSSGRMKRRR